MSRFSKTVDARWRFQHTAIAAFREQLHVPCIDLDTGLSDDQILALRGRIASA